MIFNYTVLESDRSEKVLTILKSRMKCSGTLIKRLKSNNTIYLNGCPTFTNVCVEPGDHVSFAVFEHRANDNVPAQDIPITVLYEDEYLIIVDKPPKMPVHPAGNYTHSTLANALRYYFWKKDIDMTVRPVGRLDRNTSGIVIFAKNSHIMNLMVHSLTQPDTKKVYIGLVHGHMPESAGIINLPIKRADDSIISRITSKDGKPSKTIYKVLKTFEQASLVEFRLLTGRTHQIRLHSSSLNCPIVGDGIYGSDTHTKNIIDRHALHCSYVTFLHPFTEKIISISSLIPDDIKKAIAFFEEY